MGHHTWQYITKIQSLKLITNMYFSSDADIYMDKKYEILIVM